MSAPGNTYSVVDTDDVWEPDVDDVPPEFAVFDADGVPGPPGTTGATGPVRPTFTQTITSPSDTWTITHNLGYVPAVTLYDPSGKQILGRITSNTTTQTVVEFGLAVTGSISLG